MEELKHILGEEAGSDAMLAALLASHGGKVGDAATAFYKSGFAGLPEALPAAPAAAASGESSEQEVTSTAIEVARVAVVSEEERQDLRPPASTTAAPWHIPAELASAFSLHNRSVLRRHYIDDSVRQPRTWTRGALEALVRDARARDAHDRALGEPVPSHDHVGGEDGRPLVRQDAPLPLHGVHLRRA